MEAGTILLQRCAQAYMAAYNMMRVACDETSSVADMLSIPSIFIQQVKSGSSIEFAQDLKELGNIYADIIQKETPPCVTTGFPKLDKLFRGGFPKGTLSILAGRPGHGKTSIGCFMMKRAAQAGFSSVMISLEQKNIDIYEKMMYGTGRITPEDVDRKRIAWSEYEKGVAELEKLPVSLSSVLTYMSPRYSTVRMLTRWWITVTVATTSTGLPTSPPTVVSGLPIPT